MSSCNDLPDEILVEIFGFSEISDLNRISLVCYRFYKLSTNDIVWKQFSPPTSPIFQDYKKYFVNDQILKHNFKKPRFKHEFIPPIIREPHVLKHHNSKNVYCAGNKLGKIVITEYETSRKRRSSLSSRYLSYRDYIHRGKVKDILFPVGEDSPEYVISGGVDGHIYQHDIRNLYSKHLPRHKRLLSILTNIRTNSSVEFFRWYGEKGFFTSTSDGKLRLHCQKKNSMIFNPKPRYIFQTFPTDRFERLLNYKVDYKTKRVFCHSLDRVKVYDVQRSSRKKKEEEEHEIFESVIGKIGTIVLCPNDENGIIVGASGRIIRVDIREREKNDDDTKMSQQQQVFTPKGDNSGNRVFSKIKFHPLNPNVCYAAAGRFVETIDFRKPVVHHHTRKINIGGERNKNGLVSKLLFDVLDNGDCMMFLTSSTQQEVCVFDVSDVGREKFISKISPLDVFGAEVHNSKIFCCGRSNITMVDFAFNKY